MPGGRAPLSHATGGRGLVALAVSVTLHAAVALPLLMPRARPPQPPGPHMTVELLPQALPPVAAPATLPAPTPASAPAHIAKPHIAKPRTAKAPSTAVKPVPEEPAAAEPESADAGSGSTAISTPTTGTGGASSPAVASAPGYSLGAERTPAPDYPWSARRRGIEGRVVLRLEVDAEGRPTGVELVHSSGNDTLDQAAMAALRHWRLRPALADGVPVAGRIVVPIVFKLT